VPAWVRLYAGDGDVRKQRLRDKLFLVDGVEIQGQDVPGVEGGVGSRGDAKGYRLVFCKTPRFWFVEVVVPGGFEVVGV
jgi:hypothetical protein